MKSNSESYDAFYRRGGWEYDSLEETNFLRYRILLPLGIRRDARVLEIGCGTGVHAFALHTLGLQVAAVDRSEEAIRQAMAQHPGPNYTCADAAEVLDASPEGSLDLIFARGMSWFHYELESGLNRKGLDVAALTGLIMRTLRPSGFFILQIRTDFSGSWDRTGVRNHTLEQVISFFAPKGEIAMITDWCGLPLSSDRKARASGRNLLVAICKGVPQ